MIRKIFEVGTLLKIVNAEYVNNRIEKILKSHDESISSEQYSEFQQAVSVFKESKEEFDKLEPSLTI